MNTLENYILKQRTYCEISGCMKESVRVLNLDDSLRTKAVCLDHVRSSDTEEANTQGGQMTPRSPHRFWSRHSREGAWKE